MALELYRFLLSDHTCIEVTVFIELYVEELFFKKGIPACISFGGDAWRVEVRGQHARVTSFRRGGPGGQTRGASQA